MSQTKAQLISDLVQALNFTGTASAPANGLFLSASNELKLATASTERLMINGDGITVQKGVTVSGIEGGEAQIRLKADEGDDTNDLFRLLVEDGGTGFKIQGYDGSFNTFLTVDTSGRVLIGTDTEGHAAADNLTIADAGNAGITIRSGTTSNGCIFFSDATSGDAEFDGFVQYNHGAAPFMQFGVADDTVMALKGINVGIGTTSPSTNLHVRGADGAAPKITLSEGTPESAIQSTASGSNSDLRLMTSVSGSQATKLIIDYAGKVGIGTESPGSKLHIDGGNVTNSVEIDGTGGHELYSYHDSGGVGWATGAGGTYGELLYLDESGSTARLYTGGTERFRVSGTEAVVNETGANVDFRVEGDTDTYNFLVDASTDRVGIGTSTPQAKLEIKGTNDGGNFTALHLRNAGGDGSDITINMISSTDQTNTAARSFVKSERVGSASELSFGTGNIERMRLTASSLSFAGTKNGNAYEDATLIFNIKDSNGNSKKAQILSNKSSDIHSTLEFGTTVSNSFDERMRIHTNGFVGIGTTAPSTRLHVAVNSSETTRTSHGTVFIKNTNNGASTCASLHLQASNTDSNIHKISTQKHAGGSGSDFHIDKGTLARMQMSGDNGDIKFGVDGTMIGTFTPGLSNNTTGMGLEPRNGSIFLSRSNGAVLYCNTNTDGSQLATFRRNGNEQGKIIAHSSSVSYETTSDYRLKENAVEISDGITRLKQLKPYRFNFKSNSSETLDGFFAHEAQTVVPECASGTKDQVVVQAQVDSEVYKESELGNPIYQGIDQSKLVPLLVAAVKELTARVETLEAA